MAIHMLAPALPLLQRGLGASVAQAQLVISVYLVSLGAGQLLLGPLVDRWGRVQVLLTGLGFFIAGSIASSLAPSLDTLLAARILQAIGGAAGLVSARVLVVDLFGTEGGAGQQAKLMMIVLISPALAPLIGAYLASFGGWRLVFGVLAATGVLAMLLTLRFLKRPAPGRQQVSGRRPSLFSDLARLACNRSFVLSTCVLAGGSSALYIFLASGAFVLEQQYGLGERAAGTCFLLVALASIGGTRLVHLADRRWDAMLAGCALLLTGSLLLLLLSAAGMAGPAVLTGSMMLLGLGAGVTGPAAIHNAVSAEIGLAGTGASVAGSTQMLVSGAAMIPVGWLAPITPLKLGIALVIAAGMAFAAAAVRVRQVGPRPPRQGTVL
jgi:DHA1 family bicyclomycin/chloramphenicol resistance-like MFS transporter